MTPYRRLVVFAVLLTVLGCSAEPGPTAATGNEAGATDEGAPPKAGIPIPQSVRENLGITFATVERRSVATTRRVPGEFELEPGARREYRALLAGRVNLHVGAFETVEPGQVLFALDSPTWRQWQHEAVEAEGEIIMAEANLEVARARQQEARAALGKQEERIANLEAVNVRRAELETAVADLRNSLPRLEAEIRAQEAAMREAREHYESRLNTLSSLSGLPVETLLEDENGHARWRGITQLEIRAEDSATVEDLAVTNGGWLQEGELALTTAKPTAVRFHAEAPQSDIAYFRDGQRATIAPPQGSSVGLQDAMTGSLTLGLTAHAQDRTISLYVTPETPAPWARAGISAFLEVALAGGANDAMAIPMSCVVQDGLEAVFFRRDPNDPDRALRVVADLGENDGRWVVVRSGVKAGDEIVLDGAYALKLSGGQQQAPEGYHYHADGSLHKDH